MTVSDWLLVDTGILIYIYCSPPATMKGMDKVASGLD